jgi:hypothetical protein
MDRLLARASHLSHTQLLELIAVQARASPEALRAADLFVAAHVQPPEWLRSALLLSPDLLVPILFHLESAEHRVKSVCAVWHCAWKDTLGSRLTELRLRTDLSPFQTGSPHVRDLVALNEEQLIVAYNERYTRFSRYALLDQQLRPVGDAFRVDGLREVHRLAVGYSSVYVSHEDGLIRFSINGFPSVQTALASRDEFGLQELELAPSHVIFAINSDPADGSDHDPLVAFDALTLDVKDLARSSSPMTATSLTSHTASPLCTTSSSPDTEKSGVSMRSLSLGSHCAR